MKKSLFYTFLGGVVLYLLVCVSLYMNQTDIIFPARLERQDVYQNLLLDFNKEFQFTTKDNVVLMGWLNDRHPKKPLTIYYGGNAEDITSTFKLLNLIFDDNLLSVNYRGYGKSGGKPTEMDLFSDALEIFDSIQAKNKDRPICLIGRSLGSGVACYVASSRKIQKLILLTPYDSVLNVAQEKYSLIPINLLIKHPFNSFLYSEKISAPTVFILAENDFVIPRKNSMRLYDNWKSQKSLSIIPNSDHNSLLSYENSFAILKCLNGAPLIDPPMIPLNHPQ